MNPNRIPFARNLLFDSSTDNLRIRYYDTREKWQRECHRLDSYRKRGDKDKVAEIRSENRVAYTFANRKRVRELDDALRTFGKVADGVGDPGRKEDIDRALIPLRKEALQRMAGIYPDKEIVKSNSKIVVTGKTMAKLLDAKGNARKLYKNDSAKIAEIDGRVDKFITQKLLSPAPEK